MLISFLRNRSFLVQVPFTILAMVLVAWKLPSARREPSQTADDTNRSKLARLDVLGAITMAVGIVLVLVAVDREAKAENAFSPVTILLFIASAVVGVLFILIEAYWAKEPVFPLWLFVHRDVITSYLVIGFQFAAQVSVREHS
jgi:hypothetical protein